jgi:Ca2+-binding RTX toxin-like protein
MTRGKIISARCYCLAAALLAKSGQAFVLRLWSVPEEGGDIGDRRPLEFDMVQTLIRLPFEGATTVTQGIGGVYSHTGNLYYAYDFDLDFGQQVLAMATGTVVALRETIVDGGPTSYTGDPSLGSSNIGNFVTLQHVINGRTFYSSYFHLRQGSVPLTVGAVVQEGDVLGQVGNTGARSGTHLHVQFGAASVQWTAGVVANAGQSAANLTLADELRFVGYDAAATLGTNSSVTAGAATDFAANTGTEAVLALNGTGTGAIALARDMDWFRIEVQAGQSYTVTVDAASGSALDPFLRLHDATGKLVASDDDTGAGSNALVSFTANQTTHLFLSAGGYGTSTGSYQVGFAPKGVTRIGGSGADSLVGGAGADTLSGAAGNDRLSGLAQADTLSGDSGRDVLNGGSGADRLDGGTGRDTLWGGTGADVFVFQQGDGRDVLRDFQNGLDHIRLEGSAGFASLTFSAGVGGTWVDYGDGAVLVRGMTQAQFDTGDFIFA